MKEKISFKFLIERLWSSYTFEVFDCLTAVVEYKMQTVSYSN